MRTATLTVVLAVLAGCGAPTGPSLTADQQSSTAAAADRQSYQITERIDALVVDARAAAVTLEAGDAVTWTPGQRHRLINSPLRDGKNRR